MNPYREVSVSSGSIQLAVRDYGGAGALILLLHGAGRSAADWLPMAPLLAKQGHVVAMDLRGHGLSNAGEWTLEVILHDIKAVLDCYPATNVTIVGHSLGGVLAHLYASRYGNVNQVINLDGFALQASEYIGVTPASALKYRESAEREWDWSSPILTDEAVKSEVTAVARCYSLPADTASEIVMRRLVPCGDDRYALRNDPVTLHGIQALYRSFLVVDSFFALIGTGGLRSLIFHSSPATPRRRRNCLTGKRNWAMHTPVG